MPGDKKYPVSCKLTPWRYHGYCKVYERIWTMFPQGKVPPHNTKANGVPGNDGVRKKNSSEPMGRVVSMVPAGRTPWRLCGSSGCYDSLGCIGTCGSLWSGVGAKRPGTLTALFRRRFLACFLRYPSQLQGGKRLFSALFPPFQAFTASLPRMARNYGGKLLPWRGLSSHGLEWVCLKDSPLSGTQSHRHFELGCRSYLDRA